MPSLCYCSGSLASLPTTVPPLPSSKLHDQEPGGTPRRNQGLTDAGYESGVNKGISQSGSSPQAPQPPPPTFHAWQLRTVTRDMRSQQPPSTCTCHMAPVLSALDPSAMWGLLGPTLCSSCCPTFLFLDLSLRKLLTNPGRGGPRPHLHPSPAFVLLFAYEAVPWQVRPSEPSFIFLAENGAK